MKSMTTMILESQQDAPRLGVGLNPHRRRTDNADVWKRSIGTKPIPARLAVLDDSKPRWRAMGVSAAAQLFALIFLLSLPLFFPERLVMALRYDATPILMPDTEVPPPPPPPKMKPPMEKPKPIERPVEPPKIAHLFAPPPQPVLAKPKPVKVNTPELKPLLEAKVETRVNEPRRPRDEVKLSNLGSTGSSAPPTVNLPLKQVQTGGFGDPNGLPGPGDPSKRANISRLGSPALPFGPGYGNGSGGANGVRGTVVSAGFGNGVAVPPPTRSARRGAVQVAGFADAAAVPVETPKKKASSSGQPDTEVVILDKPNPIYTDEARKLKIEGDVVLDVVFLASGRVQVNQVVSGLGHGLDDSAVRAAREIKFRPAKREGESVDYPARLRIQFRLAY
jgi:TonB family protein